MTMDMVMTPFMTHTLTVRPHAESATTTASASHPESHTADVKTRSTVHTPQLVTHADMVDASHVNTASQLTRSLITISSTEVAGYTEKLTT